MSETEKNLNDAFCGESKANRKYLAYAKKAQEEGLDGIAKLFRVAAAAETIHAFNHLNAMGLIKSTKENLKESIDGEDYELSEMYPKFIEKAKEEGNEKAAESFRLAMEVEKIHSKLFKEAIEKLEKGEDIDGTRYFYVCKKCGYPSKGVVLEKCPVCKSNDFMGVE